MQQRKDDECGDGRRWEQLTEGGSSRSSASMAVEDILGFSAADGWMKVEGWEFTSGPETHQGGWRGPVTVSDKVGHVQQM